MNCNDIDIVDVFSFPYEVWHTREATSAEATELVRQGFSWAEALNVKDGVIEVVATHADAASRMLRVGVDNGLECHINNALADSAEYSALRALMPSKVPNALHSYQNLFKKSGLPAADAAIKTHGTTLPEGQFLFHGGLWPGGVSTFTTSRPFSTSFCPQVALRNAEWFGKAYDAGRIDLMVVQVTQPKTSAYAYSREGEKGNEKEVVFASGALLNLLSEKYIKEVQVSKAGLGGRIDKKMVPAYVLEVAIS